LTTLIFWTLIVDHIEFQLLTEVYGRMRSDSTPSLVYGVKVHSRSCDYWASGRDTPCS